MPPGLRYHFILELERKLRSAIDITKLKMCGVSIKNQERTAEGESKDIASSATDMRMIDFLAQTDSSFFALICESPADRAYLVIAGT